MQDETVPHTVSAQVFTWLEAKDAHMTLLKDGDHRLSRPQDLRLLERTVRYCMQVLLLC